MLASQEVAGTGAPADVSSRKIKENQVGPRLRLRKEWPSTFHAFAIPSRLALPFLSAHPMLLLFAITTPLVSKAQSVTSNRFAPCR
jgi:hypothetical protein